MTKFTKGPWKVEECGCCIDTGASCRYMSDYCGQNFPQEELEANANLIASAPEMYAALERLARVAAVELTGKRDDVLEQAQSALAKARGEA